MPVSDLGNGVHLIDLNFQGSPDVIAAYLVEDAGERALIETGPTSSLENLLAGLEEIDVAPESIDKLLVTHIHLDHAGAAGTFMRRYPQARLYVHERGAPHMIDPSRLLASAQRIYGDQMEPLWGAFEPVPAHRIEILTDENSIQIGNRQLQALYTPGHASHHVVYHDQSGAVFTGDVAAVRLPETDYVRPPTPPPDIDLELWTQSIERVRNLHPNVLYLTHFGPFDDIEHHLQQAHDRLYDWADVVARAQASGQDRPEIVDTLRRHADRELLALTNDAALVERYELATPFGMTVDGYLRYFTKHPR